MTPCLQSPAWYAALTLAERAIMLRNVPLMPPVEAVNLNLAERRLQRWQAQSPFTTPSIFAQRLAMDGISEEGLHQLLGESLETVRNRCTTAPAWLTAFTQAFAAPAPCPPATMTSPEEQSQDTAGFLSAIEPLVRQGRARLSAGIQALLQTHPHPPFDGKTSEALLLANLLSQLLSMLNRTLALELHVARLQGLLTGDTPAARFHSFQQRLRQPDVALALFQEYPVLTRQLVQAIERWVTVNLEFLQRLCNDWPLIRTTFAPENDPGLLVQVQDGAGDTHRGGRSVQIAGFASGFQLVYKPRALAVDVHFQALLTWLNARGDHPPFKTLQVLDRGPYGWIEFVAPQPCTTPAELHRFYQRQGGYLALLYALAATDFHHENLMAVGEHPVLLDLEALFHPAIGPVDLSQADQVADNVLYDSVLGVGLLPQRVWSNAKSAGIDLSGLGGAAGQLMPYGIPQWEAEGTDEMHLIRKRLVMRAAHNRTTLQGAEVNPFDYAAIIVTGFEQIYHLLLKHREELLSTAGPLARFAQDEVRVILRNTRTYGILLGESFHPDVLRDALDRDRLFDRLWGPVAQFPSLAQVIAAERTDLQQGDIPLFTTRPDSRDLWSSGQERIADFFNEPGLTLAQRRLHRLGETDLARQRWIVQAALATLATAVDRPPPTVLQPASQSPLASGQTLNERLLAAARTVGDRLATAALHGEQSVSWIGMTPAGDHQVSAKRHHQWSLTALSTDLYAGLPGVALFLAYLGAYTQEPPYTQLAQAGVLTLRRRVERSQTSLKTIGAFEGWGGLIYTFTHLSMLWNQPELLAEATAMVEQLPALIEQDECLDLIAGSAGCIGSLLTLYHCAPSPRTLAVAIECGDHLIACAQPQAEGIGWVTLIGSKPLTGFSHGVAGMAWALLALAAVSGEGRFRSAALAALAYERSCFVPALGNWLDWRELRPEEPTNQDEPPSLMTTWCYGAPGIGLARLSSLPQLDDAEIRAEIECALQTTVKHGFGGNHSLCHGDLGNLELLLQASATLSTGPWRAKVDELAAQILDSIDQHGWRCGLPLGVESPGLMTGLAGIGYALLRLAEPARIPSVLLLTPPLCNQLAAGR